MKAFYYSLLVLGTIGTAVFINVRRWALKDESVSPKLFLVCSFGTAAVLFAAVYVGVWGFTMPAAILPGFWRAALLTAAANLIIQFLSVKAASYKQGEVSLTAPLQALTPGLITFVAVSLGEIPGPIGGLGIGLMALGSYILMLELRLMKSGQVFVPFQMMGAVVRWSALSEIQREKTTVAWLSIGSAFFGTFGLLFDGLYTRRGVNLQGLSIGSMIVVSVLTVTYLLWFAFSSDDRKEAFRAVPYWNRKLMWGSLLTGALWVGMVYAIYPAFYVDYVAYVGTLKRLSIISSGLIAWWWFKDQNIKHRLIAAAIVTLGAILLSFDNLPARISTRIEGWGL